MIGYELVFNVSGAVFPGVGQHHHFHSNAFGVLVALTFTGPIYFQQIVIFYMNYKLVILIKAALGFPSANLLQTWCE